MDQDFVPYCGRGPICGGTRRINQQCQICNKQIGGKDEILYDAPLCEDCLETVKDKNPLFAKGLDAKKQREEEEHAKLTSLVMGWTTIEDLEALLHPALLKGYWGVEVMNIDQLYCFNLDPLSEHVHTLSKGQYRLQLQIGYNAVSLVYTHQMFERLFSRSHTPPVLHLRQEEVQKYKDLVDQMAKDVATLLQDNVKLKRKLNKEIKELLVVVHCSSDASNCKVKVFRQELLLYALKSLQPTLLTSPLIMNFIFLFVLSYLF